MRSSRRGVRQRGIRNRRKRTRKHSRKQWGGHPSGRRLILRMLHNEGLGNQLFILGIGIRAQKLTKLPLYIIPSYSKYHSTNSYKTLYESPERNIFILEGDNATLVLERAKLILDKKSNHIPTKVEDSHFSWNPNDSGDLRIPDDLYQNYAGVQTSISDIKSLLMQNEFENEKNKSTYDPVRSETDSAHSAFMHIRLGDYTRTGFLQNVDYYVSALKELEKNPLVKVIYIICTDEKYYRENESKLKEATTKELRLYSNPNELAALYKMMLCTAGAILSSSTFSAWGAMMGADMNDKSTIVYPKQWIKFLKWGDNPLMFPQRWVPIDSSNTEPDHSFDWKKNAATVNALWEIKSAINLRSNQPSAAVSTGGNRINKRKYTRAKRGGMTNISSPTFSFVSYGNERFIQSRERIRKEAEQMGCFNGEIKVYTPEDLSGDFKMAVGDVLNEMRGGGYMTWKPYIIMDMLSKLNDNDILLYADAGSTLRPEGNPRLKEYAEMISPTTKKGVLVMRLLDGTKHGPGNLIEKKWTSMPIFEYFKEKLDGAIANSNQITSSFVLCRKCPESLEVIGKWLDVAKTRPDLFTDRHNEESKKLNPDFRDNRHDQSILSMITQTEPYREKCVIIKDEVEIMHGILQDLTKSPVHTSRIKV